MEIISQCDKCVFYSRNETCFAFMDGIPDAIRHNEVDHSKEFPGDNGIRFELIPGEQYTFQSFDEADLKKAGQ